MYNIYLCIANSVFAVPIEPGCRQKYYPRSLVWYWIDANGDLNTNHGCAGQWGPDSGGTWGWSEPICAPTCNGCVESFDKCVACQEGYVMNNAKHCVGKLFCCMSPVLGGLLTRQATYLESRGFCTVRSITRYPQHSSKNSVTSI